MKAERSSLESNFSEFIHNFKSKNYNDFKIKIISTDYYSEPQATHNKSPILTQDSPDLVGAFQRAIPTTKTTPRSDERGMQSLIDFLNTNEEGGHQFLQDNTYLAVFIFSDENDGSRGDDNTSFSQNSQDYVLYYKEKLETLKADKLFSVSVVINTALVGGRYQKIAKETSGTIQGIHADFSVTMKELAVTTMEDASKHQNQQQEEFPKKDYRLSRNPDASTIRVFINKELKVEGTDYHYNTENNKVIFVSPPHVGDHIEIEYNYIKF